jgi:hypothetical protein
MIFLEQNGVSRVSLHKFFNIRLGHGEHLVTDIDSFNLLEILTETEQHFPCPNRNIQIPFLIGEGLDGLAAEFLGVVGSIFLIVEALSLIIPDVHAI